MLTLQSPDVGHGSNRSSFLSIRWALITETAPTTEMGCGTLPPIESVRTFRARGASISGLHTARAASKTLQEERVWELVHATMVAIIVLLNERRQDVPDELGVVRDCDSARLFWGVHETGSTRA